MSKKTLAWIASALFTLASGLSHVSAQDMNRPPAVFSQEELDQMLAPIALYPDSLLAQVLMAATYPLEVVQAARFVDSRPGLQGDALARAIAPMPWDASVKSLVQFPSVLAMMNDKLDWTQSLGDAFLSQQANVMDTVQNLRAKAQIAGNLQSTDQQRIVQQDQAIMIEPVNPQVIYVPYYNPTVIYGSWWWPQRPPVYWAPPPRYRPPRYNVSINAGIFFGSGIGIVRSIYGNARPDWRQHHVLVNNVRITNNVTNKVVINNKPVVWQHNRRNGQNTHRPDVGNVSRPGGATPNVSHAPNQGPHPDLHSGQIEPDHRADHDRHEQNRPAPAANLTAPNNIASPSAHPPRTERADHTPRPEHRPELQTMHRTPPPQPRAIAPRPEQHVQRPAAAIPHAAPPRPERHEPPHRSEPSPQQHQENQERHDHPDRK